MASTITAGTTSGTALAMSGDTSGNLSLLSGTTTVLALTATGIAVTGTLSASGVTTNAAGSAALPSITTTGDTDTGVWFPAANTLAASTAGAERMRIDSSGVMMLSTTSALGRFTVSNPSNATVGVFIQSTVAGDVGNDELRIGKYDNNSTSSQIFARFTINNAANGSGSITGNGANSAAFGSFSDERLKENISCLPTQLDNVLALRPVEFDYKDGSGHQIGFIAQEMQAIYPDTVGDDGTEEKILTITGWDKTTARLVKAIQEQQALIIQLQADVAALKGVK